MAALHGPHCGYAGGAVTLPSLCRVTVTHAVTDASGSVTGPRATNSAESFSLLGWIFQCLEDLMRAAAAVNARISRTHTWCGFSVAV